MQSDAPNNHTHNQASAEAPPAEMPPALALGDTAPVVAVDTPDDASSTAQAAPAPLRLKMAALVTLILGGVLFGLSLGTISVYLAYDFMNEDCEGFTGERGCTQGSHRDCVWLPANGSTTAGRCAFADHATVNCAAGSGSSDACGLILAEDGSKACTYDYEDDVCLRAYGMSPLEIGLYASANVLGGLVGAPFAQAVTRRTGFTGGAITLGLLAAGSSGLSSVARATGTFWLLVVSRVLIGVVGFGCCFVIALYPNHILPPKTAGKFAAALQVPIEGGIALAAAYGLAAQPRDLSAATYIEGRIHGLHALFGALGLIWAVIALVVPESPWYSWRTGLRAIGDDGEENTTANEPIDVDIPTPLPETSPDALTRPPRSADATFPSEPKDVAKGGAATPPGEPAAKPVTVTTKAKAAMFLTGMSASVALHVTGLGAVVSFAPQITASAGFEPLEGNMLFAGMFLLCTIPGPYLAARFDMKNLYNIGTLIASAGAALIAVGVYPFMAGADKTASLVVTAIGLLLFAFGVGSITGSLFFVWAIRIFPPQMVQHGSAIVNTMGGLIQLVLVLTFPTAVVGMSGGIAGDQRVGTGAIFTIYAAIGVVSAGVNAAFLQPWEEREAKLREEQGLLMATAEEEQEEEADAAPLAGSAPAASAVIVNA